VQKMVLVFQAPKPEMKGKGIREVCEMRACLGRVCHGEQKPVCNANGWYTRTRMCNE